MNKQVVYITEPEEINLKVLSGLSGKYDLVNGDTKLDRNYLRDCENILIRTYTRVDEKTFERMPNIKNVMRVGVGLDNVDLEECKKRNVRVFNSAGSNSNAVSEYVVASILFAKRNMYQLTTNDLKTWNRFKFMGSEIKGKTVGLIGFGNIARLVYKKLKAFDCERFYVYDPYVKEESITDDQVVLVHDLDLLLKCSDIVSIHVPLNKETFHLMDKQRLGYLKEGAILINTSRGAVVCEDDVIGWMKKNKGIYVADVFESEPKVNKRLLECKNFIGTPHIASMTVEADTGMVREVVANFLAGKSVIS